MYEIKYEKFFASVWKDGVKLTGYTKQDIREEKINE